MISLSRQTMSAKNYPYMLLITDNGLIFRETLTVDETVFSLNSLTTVFMQILVGCLDLPLSF